MEQWAWSQRRAQKIDDVLFFSVQKERERVGGIYIYLSMFSRPWFVPFYLQLYFFFFFLTGVEVG
jgi:hypothetical protein